MEEVKKYLLDIGFDDAHLPELFNGDDKSYYTIPELMKAYTDHKLKLLGIADVGVELKDKKVITFKGWAWVNKYKPIDDLSYKRCGVVYSNNEMYKIYIDYTNSL